MSEIASTQPLAGVRLSDALESDDVVAVARPRGRRDDFIERAWRFFCSLKLMVVLMSLFALAMAVNTFINPQEDALANIEKAFANRPFVLWMYKAFELYAPYKSWWFTTIVLLLALNNLASSIERLPRIFLIVRNPELRLTDRVLRGLRNRVSAPRGDLNAERLRGELEQSGYRVTRIEEGGTTHLFAERGAWTRFGVWVVHLALLGVCFGGIVGRLFAFEGMMELPEGGRANFFRERMADGTSFRHMLPGGFYVQCDNFDLDRFADGSAMRYASDLSVLDPQGNVLFKKRIVVNDPLRWEGLTFYQATYAERPDESTATLLVRDRTTNAVHEVSATPTKPIEVDDGRVRFTVVNYEPEFGELGPAVQVVREEFEAPLATAPGAQPKDTTSFWVFANYPEFDATYRGDRFGLEFKGLEPGYVTGLQVGYDPGVLWINIGCLFLFLGLLVTFWTVHRRIWVRFEGDQITLAGAAHRNRDRFKQEFDAFVARLGVSAR